MSMKNIRKKLSAMMRIYKNVLYAVRWYPTLSAMRQYSGHLARY
jgi:hypothetical protein